MNDHDKQVLDALGPLIGAGFALHYLHPREKRPIGEDWSTRPVASVEAMRRRHAPGNNLGVRLGEVSETPAGYLYVCDIDIRAAQYAAEALTTLNKLFPELDVTKFPVVRSGSGGDSRHVYFVSDKPFHSFKFARSEGFDMVPDPKKGREVKKRHWELEIFGTGKQVAMPPSIHPDTGQPYTWLRPFDFDLLALGEGPFVPSEAIERLGAVDSSESADAAGEMKPRLGLTVEQAEEILDFLPLDEWCEDRDGWLQVGMALHHEFGEDGYELWAEFSQQSEKFDEKNQRQVWKSFRLKPNSVRMATLKAAAATERLRQQFGDNLADAFEDLDEPDDVADMIGGAAPDPLAGFDDNEARLANGKGLPFEDILTLLQVNPESGAIATTLHNVEMIVRYDPRLVGLPQVNEFTQEIVQRTPPGTKPSRRRNAAKETRQLGGRIWDVADRLNGDLWSEDRDFAIRSILEAPMTQGGYGIKITDRDLRAAVSIVANENAFHPVREYLEGLVWDAVPRVESLYSDYLGADDNVYTRSVSRLTLVGGVTRIFEPGHKFDFSTILEGIQGKRKSTFIQVLGRSWFAELDGDFHDTKQMVELMQGAWIMEIPELSGFGRGDVRTIKAFISRQKDRARLAYARRAGSFPRQCIFIGSTNDREYLKDDTGGRRFWPMICKVREIDIDRLERNIDQIWAEAVVLYRQMREKQPRGTLPLYLTDPEARRIAAELQESRRVETADDAMAGRIGAWLDRPVSSGDSFEDGGKAPQPRNETCLIEIWTECLGAPVQGYNVTAAQMLGRAMKLIPGWDQVGFINFRAPYGRQRCYSRGGEKGRLIRMGALPAPVEDLVG